MNNIYRVWLIVALYVLTALPTLAQIDFGSLEEEQIYRKGNKYNTWSITIGGGAIVYYTDVIDYTFLPTHDFKLTPTLMVSKQFNRPWAIDAQVFYANMYGEKNDRYFKGDLIDATLNLTCNINQLAIFGPINDKWNIYAKLGFGLVAFRSTQRTLIQQTGFNGNIIQPNDPMQVGDVYPYIDGYPSPYGWKQNDFLAEGYSRIDPSIKEKRKTEIVVPFGLGVKYRMSKTFDVGFELMLRTVNQDNLDVNMSGADNDSYATSTFGLTYKFGKKDKRHASWTYKDINFSFKRQRENDPLAQKLDSLKQTLEYLAANDTVVADTTVINNVIIEHLEDINASVFFEFDKSIVTSASQKTISRIARALRKNPEAKILVVGYCDERGADDYNVKLSIRRCNSVKDVLVKDFAIEADRIQTDPKGESELLSDTKNLKPRGLHLVNRRVDIFMIKE